MGNFVTLKKTKLLIDDPASADEFGTHEKIAKLIYGEILDAKDGRSIAIVGDWGSGKSTIVSLLSKELRRREPPDAHVFIYDAWSHQGDELQVAGRFSGRVSRGVCGPPRLRK